MFKWNGPFRIVDLPTLVNVRLQTLSGRRFKQLIHVSRLKKYISPAVPKEIPEVEDEFDWELEEKVQETVKIKSKRVIQEKDKDKEIEEMDMEENLPIRKSIQEQELQEYSVEKILKSRFRNGVTEYFVKWKGYDEFEGTWEPEENLEHCQAKLKRFWKASKLTCEQCEFRASSRTGLKTHMKGHVHK